MKLMTLKQYMNMSKPALIRKIMKTLRVMPKKRLAVVCYNLTKSKLPRLRKIKRQKLFGDRILDDALRQSDKRIKARARRKTKRKFSRKQLAAQRLFAKRARAGTLRR